MENKILAAVSKPVLKKMGGEITAANIRKQLSR